MISILRPPIGPQKCGLVLKVVLYKGLIVHKMELWEQILWSYNQGGLKIKSCKTEGLLYYSAFGLCRVFSIETQNVKKLGHAAYYRGTCI